MDLNEQAENLSCLNGFFHSLINLVVLMRGKLDAFKTINVIVLSVGW